MTITRETPEKLTDARTWLATMPALGDFEPQLTRLLEDLLMLFNLREMAEELATVVRLADLYDVQPSEVDTASQFLAFHHRVVDGITFELEGYLPGGEPLIELPTLRAVIYWILGTADLGKAIHGHELMRR